jgi:hypothetical protein
MNNKRHGVRAGVYAEPVESLVHAGNLNHVRVKHWHMSIRAQGCARAAVEDLKNISRRASIGTRW